MEDSKKVYGIDLGTTYSCIATIDEYDRPVVLQNGEGQNVTPSVVFYEEQDNIVVGDTAKNEIDAERKVSYIKRDIGNDNFVSSCIFPEDPVTVSAYILKKLVNDANEATMEDIKDVVITCPAYFGSKERLQTQQAGEIAGLNVLSVINEPTAAAISYGLTAKEDKKVMVYDLGGGTFDVTIIDVTDECIRVIATGGDSRLGGADWDKELVNYLADQFETETGIGDILSDPETEANLYLLAEKAKQMLTQKEKYRVTVVHEGTTAKIEITRSEFESFTTSLLSRTISILNDVVLSAKEKDEKYTTYDDVLLVGGSCRMPQIKQAVDEALNCDAKKFDPDEAVAKGAAMYAMFSQEYKFAEAESDGQGGFATGPKGIGGAPSAVTTAPSIINVLSKTYGIGSIMSDLKTEVISTMVFEQDELPAQAADTFVTVEDGQSSMKIELFETSATRIDIIKDGDYSFPGVYRCDGEACFENPAILDFGKGFPKGQPVEVTVQVDEQGRMVVTACEKETGNNVEVECTITGVRTKEEIKAAASQLAQKVIQG